MPGDTKPHLARQEKKRARRPKPGTVKQLSAVLWRAITHLETHLDITATAETVDTGELCKLTHALSQSASTYLKAVEVGELEARLGALEKAQELTQDTPRQWAA
jgi:transcriptional regulator of aromatic amino acid metabolism